MAKKKKTSDTIEIRFKISIGLSEFACEHVFSCNRKDWENTSSEGREEMLREWAGDYVDMTYEEVAG